MSKVVSRFTGKEYEPENSCRIINMSQLAFYMDSNVDLLDLYASKDYKTGKPILVGVVDKVNSYEAYKQWCNHMTS